MTRAGRACTVLFTLCGLIALQSSLAGTGPIYELPAYALVALGAVIGGLTLWRSSAAGADKLSLVATALFGGYIVARALTSPAPYQARADLYAAIACLAIYGCVAFLLPVRSRMFCIAALLVGAVGHVFVAVVQFGIGENFVFLGSLRDMMPSLRSGHVRATGFYANPDHLAGLLEVLAILSLSLACWSRWPRAWRVTLGYIALICYIGLALTGSRGGYLSAVASLLVFGLLSLLALRRGGARLFWGWGVTAAMGLAAAVYVGTGLIQNSPTLAKRVDTIVAPDQARLELWRAAVDQWKLQPWEGTGARTYQFYARQFRVDALRADPAVAHNDYVQLLAEYGVVGIVAFLLFFAAHVRSGWLAFAKVGPRRIAGGAPPLSDRLALTIGGLSALAAYVLHSAVDFNMHIPANALLMTFVIALLANPLIATGAQPRATKTDLIGKAATALIGIVLLVQSLRLLPAAARAAEAEEALDANEPQPARAIAAAEAGLSSDPRNPRLYRYLSAGHRAAAEEEQDSAKRADHMARALAAIHKARTLSPLDSYLDLSAALIYDTLHRYPEAEWMFWLARQKDPNSIELAKLYRIHLWRWRNHR
jgi:O-antigen ligase